MASNVAARIRIMTAAELAAARTRGDVVGQHEEIFVSDAAAGQPQRLRGTGVSIASAETVATAGQSAALKHNFAAVAAPTAGDDSGDGYSVGSRWVDTSGGESYICVGATVGAAVWSKTTVGTIAEVSGLQTALDAKEPAITTLAVAKGGTGATTAAAARTSLGLGAAATLSVGTATGTVAAGDDSRMANARTPTAHAASHGSAGADAVTPAGIGAEPTIAAGGLAVARGGTGSTTATGARTALGLGTAALATTGTAAGQVPVLDGSARLPAVDGSQLSGISSSLPGGTPAQAFDDGLATTGSPAIDRATVAGETILAFAASGSITIPDHVSQARVLLVGGGGGGGVGRYRGDVTGRPGGGGGAGGLVAVAAFGVTPGATLTVTVGAGGAGATDAADSDAGTTGQTGANSVLGSLTAYGGGGGGGHYAAQQGAVWNAAAKQGGSGGGASNAMPGATQSAAAAAANNTGNTGGSSADVSGGGGGGGAGGAGGGVASGASAGGTGGAGLADGITGSSITYAAGGAGASSSSSGAGAAGAANRGNGGAGASESGSDGAAAGSSPGGAGGSGIVIIRFPTQTRTYQALGAHANDATAAAAGVLLGQFYRDSATAAVRQRAS